MSYEEEESNGGEENSHDIVEFDLERVQWDQGNSDTDNKSDTVWCYKLQQLIDHVRDAIVSLIWSLGTFLLLDEMMMHFMGCSTEMH
eukprot:2378341-Ditylum_brightwellii.AAC.1